MLRRRLTCCAWAAVHFGRALSFAGATHHAVLLPDLVAVLVLDVQQVGARHGRVQQAQVHKGVFHHYGGPGDAADQVHVAKLHVLVSALRLRTATGRVMPRAQGWPSLPANGAGRHDARQQLTSSSSSIWPSLSNTLSVRMKRYSRKRLTPQGPLPGSSMRYKPARPEKHHVMTCQEYMGGEHRKGASPLPCGTSDCVIHALHPPACALAAVMSSWWSWYLSSGARVVWGMRMVRAPPNTGAHERGGKEGVTAHKSAHSPSRDGAVVWVKVVLDLACASRAGKGM